MQKQKRLKEVRRLKSLEDTKALAAELVPLLQSRQLIGLQGAMASGKTHFVKALAEALGLDSQNANSPTFAIHQQYENEKLILHHLDLFRLETEEEIESSGFWDLFYEDQVIIAVEWIDRVSEEQIPQHFSYLRLDWALDTNGDRLVSIFVTDLI
jgi:tRNA threonylcarbamoyladenosine biosynthesis protein TsaE